MHFKQINTMTITRVDIQKALKIRNAVTEYFILNPSESRIQAKELMPFFIKKGIFTDNDKDGLPIRKLLRHLDEGNHLHIIPQAQFEQKAVNKNWFFIKSV